MKKKILVVEDDADISAGIKAFLEIEGFDAELACDGLEALELLREPHTMPVVILLDLMMPRMDGFAFRAIQLKDPRLSKIPVVLMTASAQAEEHKAVTGACGLVKKPFDLEILSKLLKKF